MTALGFILMALSVAVLVALTYRTPRRRPFGPLGWLGLTVSCTCGAVLLAPTPKPEFLGALAWTGIILAVDSSVHAIRGRSLIRSSPAAFAWLAVLSIFLWLPFEWYNLRLAAWYRSGLPVGPVRYLLMGWSFACIWPALFEMADLLMAVTASPAPRGNRPAPVPLGRAISVVVLGGACLATPLLVPRLDLGEHLLPLGSIGFLLLLDPLNCLAGRPSLWDDWHSGDRVRIMALALASPLCGLIADCLNYGADAKWHSIYRAGPDLGALELPLVAYLALSFFALQALAMHRFVTGALDLPHVEIPTVSAAGSGSRPLDASG